MTFSRTTFSALFSLAMLSLALQANGQVGEQGTPVPEIVPETSQAEELEETIDVTGAEQDVLLAQIAAALGSVQTAQGRFTQYDVNYNQTSGNFYLRRPGRVRFEYDAPSPLLIVADGATVAIEDKDLETQDRVPLRATPLALILDDEIDFTERVNVLAVRKANGVIGVMLEDKTGETEGSLLLVVDSEDYDLIEWQTVEPDGRGTSVQLAGVETGISLNPRLFRIEELDAEDERD